MGERSFNCIDRYERSRRRPGRSRHVDHVEESDMMLCRAIGLLGALALLAGCASVELASGEADIAAKRFVPVPGQAVLYVIQDGGYSPYQAMFQIAVNGRPQGSIMGYTYHRVTLPPGQHTITATSAENERVLQVSLEPNSVSFVGADSSIGWRYMRVGNLRRLTESEGRKAVGEAKMARGLQ